MDALEEQLDFAVSLDPFVFAAYAYEHIKGIH